MSKRFSNLWLIATIALVSLFALQAVAQNATTGAISGTVTDPSGAVVSGAAVSIVSVETGSASNTTTAASGTYGFALLTPGQYKVTVKQSGFRTTEQTVPVAVGQTSTVNLHLTVGQGSEVVEVSGTVPLIQTEDANIQTTFSAKQVDLLPNGGNDLTAVANTSPGIQINTSSGGGYGNFTAFGLPATSNLFTVNGNDENDPYLNLNNSGATNLLLGKNEVQEVSVVANGYTGQYGRMAGAQVDYATKSGTHDWHGNAQYYFNSGGMNSNDWFLKESGTPLPQENNNQWAASIGGPVKKDKLFFFFDTEGLRYILGTASLVNVPTPAFASAVEANLTSFGLATSASVPFYTNNVFGTYLAANGINRAVPLNNTTDVSGNLGCGDLNTDYYNWAGGGVTGSANVVPGFGAFGGTGPNAIYGGGNNGGGTPCTQQFRSNAGQLSHEYIIATRVDLNATNSDKLNFRFRADRGLQATYTDPVSPVFNADSGQPQDEGQMNWIHNFGPRVLNSFIMSGLYYSAFFLSANQTAATAQFPYAQLWFDTNGWANLGGINYAFPQGRNVTQAQFVDDLSITRGPHELKMGVNFKRLDITDGIFAERAVTPLTEVISTTDYALGFLDVYAQRFPSRLEQPIALYSMGLYFQDQWKASKDVKMTLTLRVDRNSNAVCQTNCFTSLNGGDFAQITHDPNQPYNTLIKNNQHTAFPGMESAVWQPRFGVAWTPFGHQSTVLRGGIGLFADLYPGTIVDSFARNSPQLNYFVVNGLLAPTEPAGSAQASAAAANVAFIANYNSGGSATTLTTRKPAFNSVVNTLKNPKYLEWNFEIQQAFGSKTAVNLNYVGNRGTDEFIGNNSLNAYSTAGFVGLPSAIPDPHFRVVTLLNNAGISNYNGLTASITRRFTYGFTGSFNYTWSHALDEVSNGGVLPYSGNDSFLAQIDPTNLRRLNYSNADYDVRHNVSANYVWELPFKASGMMNKLVSGWSVSGTVFWRTGYPFTVQDGAAPNGAVGGLGNASGLTILPDYLGGGEKTCLTPGPASSPTQCLTSSQFTQVGSETNFGNLPRNSFRGPHYFNTDLSVLKNIPITEHILFGLGANAYNVLNHPSFANPIHDTSSGQFGQIQGTVEPPTSPYGAFVGSAVSGRILQVQARLTF